MRWPVRSWKLHASKMVTTRSWMSWLSRACLVRRLRLGHGAGGLVDRFRCLEDLLRRFLGAADHRAQLAGDLHHLVAAEALAVQHRDLALGAVDGFVDQVELDLQLFALLNLRAIGIERRLHIFHLYWGRLRDRFAAVRRRHLCADRAQLRHDLVVIRHRSSVDHFGHRHRFVADFFDTKAFPLNRHLTSPKPYSSSRSSGCFLTRGSQGTPQLTVAGADENLRLTMRSRSSSKINAVAKNSAFLASW